MVDIVRTDERYAYVNGGVGAGERITITAIESPTNGMSVRTSDAVPTRSADGEIAAHTVGN